MRVLVLGNRGQVGHELMAAAWPRDTELIGADAHEADITRAEDVNRIVRETRPDVVANVAAYTAVDRAEAEPETARAVNEAGARHVGAASATQGALCVHFSTDYVFDGTKDGPWTEDDRVAPLSVYGATKEAGERAVRETCPRHLILRTSWVYGVHGANFVKTVLRLQRERETLRIVADQRGRPTEASELAAAVVRVVTVVSDPGFRHYGTFHVAGLGATTWHELAVAVVESGARHGLPERRVDAITTEEYPTPARRPRNSVLDCTRAERVLGIVGRPWRESVAGVVDRMFATEAAR